MEKLNESNELAAEKKKAKKKVLRKFEGTTPVFDQYGNPLTVGLVNVNASTFINWQRVWIDDLAKIIELFGEGKIKVFTHILKNTNRVTNEFGGTVREISEQTDASTKTVQDVINKLILSGFMRKKRVAAYMVNPEIINYGKDKKVGYLMIQYTNLAEPTPLEKEIIERQKKRAMEEELNAGNDKYNLPKIVLQD